MDLLLVLDAPSFVGVWLRYEAWLAVRGGGTGERTLIDDGDSDTGVGTTSAGILDGGGIVAGAVRPPEDGLVPFGHAGQGRDVHQHLVHADPAQHRAGPPVDADHSPPLAEQAGIAVGVAGAEGGGQGGPPRREAP